MSKRKLIVEVEDTLYEGLKKFVLNDPSCSVFPETFRIIAKGKPYEEYKEGMRLIDANSINYGVCPHNDCDNGYTEACKTCPSGRVKKMDIDELPTIEAYTLEDMQNNFDAGAESEAGKHDKIDGEWIDETRHGYVECPNCSEKTTCYGKLLISELHYCWNCGAHLVEAGYEDEEPEET